MQTIFGGRYKDDDENGEDDLGDPPDDPSPFDWNEFDRLRSHWGEVEQASLLGRV